MSANTVYLELEYGVVTIELRPDVAPAHVEHIKRLIDAGFYNGLKWHRVIEGFMAQTGCPLGLGVGGCGYNLRSEFNTIFKWPVYIFWPSCKWHRAC